MTIGADAVLQVGDIAREAGVNIQTVRYYERRGLVPPDGRSSGGYRLYTADAIRVVRFIKRAQTLGFSLDEVAELLELRRDARGPARNVRALASAKIADIDVRLQGLMSMHHTLSRLVADCQCDAHASPEDCVILNALDDAPSLPTAADHSAAQSHEFDSTLAATCGPHGVHPPRGDHDDHHLWNARQLHLLLRQGLLPVQLRLPCHGRLMLRQVHRLLRVQQVARADTHPSSTAGAP